MTALLALVAAIPIQRISIGQLTRARDLWLLLALGASILWLLPREPWLAAMACYFLIFWPLRGVELLPSLVTWVAIAGTWFALRESGVLPYLPWWWLVVAVQQVGVMVWQRFKLGEPASGLLGQRTIAAGYLAIVAPFAPWWLWPVLALGLVLTESWLALGATIIGLGVLHPASLLISLPGVCICLWMLYRVEMVWYQKYTTRGRTMKTVWARLGVWYITVAHLSLRGAEPNTTSAALRRWSAQYGMKYSMLADIHNEPLQHVYEYGGLGAAALVAFAFRVGSGLELGDPWSAAAVVGALIACGSLPCRVAPVGVTWLAICAGVAR